MGRQSQTGSPEYRSGNKKQGWFEQIKRIHVRRHKMLLKCSARGMEGTLCDAEKKISNYHSTHTNRDPTEPWLDGANTRKAKPGGLKHTKRPRTEKPDPRTAARTTVVQPNHESILHFQNPWLQREPLLCSPTRNPYCTSRCQNMALIQEILNECELCC